LASRFFRRRSRSDAACFSLLAFRFTFFFASISFRFELPAGFVVAMILKDKVWKIESQIYNHKIKASQAPNLLIAMSPILTH
jgi:hypothetical protein